MHFWTQNGLLYRLEYFTIPDERIILLFGEVPRLFIENHFADRHFDNEMFCSTILRTRYLVDELLLIGETAFGEMFLDQKARRRFLVQFILFQLSDKSFFFRQNVRKMERRRDGGRRDVWPNRLRSNDIPGLSWVLSEEIKLLWITRDVVLGMIFEKQKKSLVLIKCNA